MANKKISELTSYTSPVSGDVLPINDTTNTTTKKVTIDNLLNALSSLFRIKDPTDTTKKVAFDVSGVTTATTRTITVPDADLTMVGTSTTQTLTNKTLTSPTINLGSDAEGDTYYRNSSGAFVRLPRGTDNYILKMNGNVPNWEVETVTVDASTTVKGIVEIATSAEITAGTATGGTGAALVVTPDALLASRPVTEVQTFSSAGSTSWTKPTNAKWVEVTVIGAGGGGASGDSGAGGGGGGGYGFQRFNASVLGSTETVVVGAGGIKDQDGGVSSFGTTTLLRATGGSKGITGAGGAGGTANGSIHYTGGAGGAPTGGSPGTDTAVDPSPRGGGGAGYNGGTPASAQAGGAGGAFITNYVKAGGAGGNTSGTNGSAPSSTSTGLLYGGTGGGGGGRAASGSVIGGGGAGNLGSGGGGGGVTNGGGTGGDGLVVVVTYF